MSAFDASKKLCDMATKRPWEIILLSGEFDDNGNALLNIQVKRPITKLDIVQAHKDAAYMSVAINHFPEALDRMVAAEEKQKPQKVIPNKRIPDLCKCPICKTELCSDDELLHYCPTCGQALQV